MQNTIYYVTVMNGGIRATSNIILHVSGASMFNLFAYIVAYC